MNHDRTTIEKPERKDRNFSIVVPFSLYQTLKKIALINDAQTNHRMSLGWVCRHLLDLIPYRLYAKLHILAAQKKTTVPILCRQILENAVSKIK